MKLKMHTGRKEEEAWLKGVKRVSKTKAAAARAPPGLWWRSIIPADSNKAAAPAPVSQN